MKFGVRVVHLSLWREDGSQALITNGESDILKHTFARILNGSVPPSGIDGSKTIAAFGGG